MNKLRPTDIMSNKDILVFSETQKVQPRSHLLCPPLVDWDVHRKWFSQTGNTNKIRAVIKTNKLKSLFMDLKGGHRRYTFSPGRDNVPHVSLFLLFLSFLNFGTRQNFALRPRFEKSVRGPWRQIDG